eukprot:c28857_g1_i1 orf=512-2548(+)
MGGFGINLGGLLAAVAAGLVVHFFTLAQVSLEDNDRTEGDQEEVEDDNAKGQGTIEPVKLKWSNLTCALHDKTGKNTKLLLKNVSGEAMPGRLLAIMGPSGSGKTTLLNVLAGQLFASPHLELTGHLYINGRPFSSSSHKLAYVRQEDLFFSQLTVRETLSLAAELQLPMTMTSQERKKYVDDLLYRLGLASSADTCVGDSKVRGISGGERKRLSIACELMASPSVIFSDEPTTGLDAFQAERVMETLQRLANDGHTVVCSIHQPRGSIYVKFDDLILLSEGSIVYAGPAQDHVLSYFAELGHECPEHVNPAEFFADLISIDYSSSDSESDTRKRLEALVKSFLKRMEIDDVSRTIVTAERTKYAFAYNKTRCLLGSPTNKSGWWRQFFLLLKRTWMQTTRDGPTNKVRLNMSVTSAIIFGSIFWRMGLLQTSIQDRMGLLQVAAINTAMAALTKTLNVFPKERQIVNREYAKGSYALGPYLLAKLIAETPVGASFPLIFGAILYPMACLHPRLERFSKFSAIVTVESFAASAMGLMVGAMVPTQEAAMALGPSLMTVFIVFGGYYVNSENTPAIFRWLPRISLIRWAFQALCLNEFRGLKFEHHNSYDLQTGEQVLEKMSFGNSTVKGALAQEGQILLFLYCMTYVLLLRNKPKYQHLELPAANPEHGSLKIEELAS